MATLSAVLATTHHPFFYKATELTPPEEQMPQAAEWKSKVASYRETLTAAEPDLLVMVGSDHFHQFFHDNYPTFLIGKQPRYDAASTTRCASSACRPTSSRGTRSSLGSCCRGCSIEASTSRSRTS